MSNLNYESGTITWEERDGRGLAILRWDDGTEETAPLAEPINAGTDSHAVANLFGGFDTVEHDRDHINVSDIGNEPEVAQLIMQ